MTKPYNREVFERLRQTLEVNVPRKDTLVAATDDIIAPNYDMRDDGLWLKLDSTGVVSSLDWTPAFRPLSAPALPFPFDAHDLAAFMLGGWGQFLGDRFSILERGPDQELLDLLLSGPLDVEPREALIAAGHALKEARSRIATLESEWESAKRLFAEAQARHPDKSNRESLAALRAAREAEGIAAGAWRKAMVQELLQPAPATDQIAEAIAEASGAEPTRSPAVDNHKEKILACMRSLGYDPRRLPRLGQRAGSPAKAKVRNALVHVRGPALTVAQFDRAWKALHKAGLIAEE